MEQVQCGQSAEFRYTWAGQDESFCCFEHGQQIQGVAQAIGYHIQLIQLAEDEEYSYQNEELESE